MYSAFPCPQLFVKFTGGPAKILENKRARLFLIALYLQNIHMKYILLLCMAASLTACTAKEHYDINGNDAYESSRASLGDTEKKNPKRFLKVTGTDRKNIIGQTVVRGTIYNSAKVVTYKDVDIQLSFYSKTGTLLEQDDEIVYESVEPGGSKTFKSKYFTPRGTASVKFEVKGAKY